MLSTGETFCIVFLAALSAQVVVDLAGFFWKLWMLRKFRAQLKAISSVPPPPPMPIQEIPAPAPPIVPTHHDPLPTPAIAEGPIAPGPIALGAIAPSQMQVKLASRREKSDDFRDTARVAGAPVPVLSTQVTYYCPDCERLTFVNPEAEEVPKCPTHEKVMIPFTSLKDPLMVKCTKCGFEATVIAFRAGESCARCGAAVRLHEPPPPAPPEVVGWKCKSCGLRPALQPGQSCGMVPRACPRCRSKQIEVITR